MAKSGRQAPQSLRKQLLVFGFSQTVRGFDGNNLVERAAAATCACCRETDDIFVVSGETNVNPVTLMDAQQFVATPAPPLIPHGHASWC